MALCNVGLCCVCFSKTDFKKRKLKLKLRLALFQRQNIIGSRTHTDTHIDGDVTVSDENGTKALCATDFIIYPRQCACKIFKHVIA